MKIPHKDVAAKTQIIREGLRQAVARELERKRRLGHYAVYWKDGRMVLLGEDTPRSSAP